MALKFATRKRATSIRTASLASAFRTAASSTQGSPLVLRPVAWPSCRDSSCSCWSSVSQLPAVLGLLPGLGNGHAQGGQLAADGQQLLDQVGQRRVGPFGGQEGPLGEHFLGHGLAVEDPARRAQDALGIGPLVQPQRQGVVEVLFILGPQEGQLFFFAQDGQGAGHVAADDPPLSLGLGDGLGPALGRRVQQRQVVQAASPRRDDPARAWTRGS